MAGENPTPLNSTEAANDPLKDITTAKETPSLFLKGFIIGSADVVPGVSGGTMALILGIYIRLIHAIKSANLRSLKAAVTFDFKTLFDEFHWKFLLTLLLGIFAALIFFTRIIPLPILMHSHPELIYGLFFGLIAGSILLLVKQIKYFKPIVFLWLIIGTVIGFFIVTLVPVDLPSNPFILFGTGAIAITALILPGISGSFLLLILRQYDVVLGAFRQLGGSNTIDAFWILVPFGLGMVAGIILFVRFLSWLLRHYRLSTLCVLIGFMIGSLYIIWPFQDRDYIASERIEIVSISDDRVNTLQEADTQPQVQLEFERLGKIKNPEAPLAQQQIEIIQVKMKLVRSTPYIPISGDDSRLTNGSRAIWEGFIMLFSGFTLVLILGFFASKQNDNL